MGGPSSTIGEPSIEDVNGDGVDDKVQRVSPAVYGEDSDELFIKVDCPEGVIGCDLENAQLVIKKNGQWIIVDENQSIVREITTDDPSSDEYPPGGYTPNDRAVAVEFVEPDDFPPFHFFFAEPVLTVKWTAIKHSTTATEHSALDINPPNAGGGQRIYPGKQNPNDPIDRKIVKIEAKLTDKRKGVRIWFKVFDVDDPTSNSAPVDDEQDYDDDDDGDNRGSWSQPAVSSDLTDADGVAKVKFKVSMQPGDNFRALASTEGVNAFEGMRAKQDDGSKARVIDGRGNAVEASRSLGISKLLSVWRKVHVEVDSMGVVTGNQISGQITKVASLVTTDQTLNDSINRFENGIFSSDGVDYEVTRKFNRS